MNPLIGRMAIAVAGLSLLTACDHGPLGTGPVRTETRQVSDFDAIEVDGATRLKITIGVPASLEVEGRDPFLERLRTEVHGNTLHIKVQRKDWLTLGTSPRLEVRVGVPQLDKLEVDGGNDIRLDGFNGGDTNIRLQGASNLVAEGRLDELRIFMAGAGHADLGDLVTAVAEVTVAGVGSVLVHPTDSLDATMNGVGSILYSGNPRHVNTRMNGLGAISHRDGGEARREDDRKPVDPDSLQPEYDRNDTAADHAEAETTEVI